MVLALWLRDVLLVTHLRGSSTSSRNYPSTMAGLASRRALPRALRLAFLYVDDGTAFACTVPLEAQPQVENAFSTTAGKASRCSFPETLRLVF